MMDPISTGIITGLIVNGLTTLASYGITKLKKTTEYEANILKALRTDTTLTSDMQRVIATMGTTEPFSSNQALAARAQSFLKSPTAESIVRQMYSDYMTARGASKSTEQLQEEFKICFANHLGTGVKAVDKAGEDLFEVILAGCRKALDLAITKGILSAHEAKSITRHRALLDELRAIRSNLDFLGEHPGLDLNAIEDFEEQYRHQVATRYKQITIPHFDRAPMVDINDIFVAPNFVCPPQKEKEERDVIPSSLFLARLYRCVLLGDPGGGKSTLAQKICYDLCTDYNQRVVGQRLLTPVIIVLREYSAKKRQDNSSIIQFIESEATAKYQLPHEAPFGTFEYLLHNGHLLVIFDGLDELLDPSYRREVSKDIELFCELFPSVPVLVTSRVVGYEQAPLSSDKFETYHLAPFSDEQVSEYVNKWFSNDPSLTPDEKKHRAKAFLAESGTVSDLRSNPLMLALMCNLYRGAGFIPRNRPEVYKKCSEMLFERWDPSRGIWVHLPISEPKVLLSQLAHWVYSNEPLQSGVAEDALIKEASYFLYPRRFESVEEAEKASKEFIEFCRGRAWVFTDTGTTAAGIPLYKFTHKTFLEYFTAAHVVRNNSDPKKLWRLLGPKVAQRAWDIIAQLAFQMLHEQVEGASDELFTMLLKDAQERIGERWQYLSFSARCLQFVYPPPKTIRNLVRACVECLTEDSRPASRNRRKTRVLSRHTESRGQELVEALLLVAPECRSTVADSIENEIIKTVNKGVDDAVLRAIDLSLVLPIQLHRTIRASPSANELQDYWTAVQNKILVRIDTKLEAHAPRNFLVFLHWYRRGDSRLARLFEWYGPDYLFKTEPHIIFPNVFRIPIAEMIVGCSAMFDVDVPQSWAERIKAASKDAVAIGEMLTRMEMPCFSRKMIVSDHFTRPHELPARYYRWAEERDESTRGAMKKVRISGIAVIGFWCLWAVYSETADNQKELIDSLRRAGSTFTESIADIIEARIEKTPPDTALKSLAEFNPPSGTMEFVRQWINGEVSFVGP